MSGPFPSMICNEPPPLDSEDEDSESFRDFPSAGLKLDILGEPTPQQSPAKSPLKKAPVENGQNASETPSPEESPFQSPLKKPLIENGVDNVIVDSSIQQYTNKSPSDADNPSIDSCKETEVEGTLQSSTVHVQLPVKSEMVENGPDLETEPSHISEKQPIDQFYFTNDIENGADSDTSPEQSPFQSPFKAVFENHVNEESEPSEHSPVHFPLNEELLENSLDADVETESSQQQSPIQSQSPLQEDFIENCQDDEVSDMYSAESNSESNKITLTTDNDLQNAQYDCAQSGFDDADDDFGDFEAFQSNSSTTDVNDAEQSPNNMKTSYIGTLDIENEEFGNFAEATFAPVQNNSYLNLSVQELPSQSHVETPNVNDNDNFGDFEDFQSSSSSFINTPKAVPLKVLDGIESKLEVLVKSVFNSIEDIRESESKAIVPLDKQLNSTDTSEEWRHVQDFEGSQGLQFKWSNCAAHQRMLHSLKIDTTAVMYTGKWGTIEVPRFAASIVESPLQPKVYSNSNAIDDELSSSTPSAQSAQETASSRETVTINQQQKSQSGRRGQGSSEAQQILDQLPDLSFMRAKTLVFANQIQE